MHSLEWFWNTGIHDPAWVQAIAAVALLVLTIVTLIILFIYTWDTHTLAKVSVQQIALAKHEWSVGMARQNHIAFDCLMKARENIENLAQSLVDGGFGAKPLPAIYPAHWPDATSIFGQRNEALYTLMANFGVELRLIDSDIEGYFNASDNDERVLRQAILCKHVEAAVLGSDKVLEALKISAKQ
jgi:hypothetical protein